ncbi:MAG TPA: histidine phosphatase family protein [Anaerolineales bacterium]|jgi:probable phosphoglycerate mutase|nr:histidine phosphatase family protein [Anaerolineales bacterium]
MPVILLIRHGENDYVKKKRLAGRKDGVHLNEKGRAQAQLLAEKLAGAPIKAVYSSPLDRTMETAKPIAKALGLKVIPRPGLLETDIGKWQGKKLKKLGKKKIWQAVQHAPSLVRFPEGESFSETQQRMCCEIEAICAEHEPQDLIACVGHSDPIKLAVAYYLGLPLDMFQRLTVAPASITALYLGDSSSRLLTLNYDLSLTFSKP